MNNPYSAAPPDDDFPRIYQKPLSTFITKEIILNLIDLIDEQLEILKSNIQESERDAIAKSGEYTDEAINQLDHEIGEKLDKKQKKIYIVDDPSTKMKWGSLDDLGGLTINPTYFHYTDPKSPKDIHSLFLIGSTPIGVGIPDDKSIATTAYIEKFYLEKEDLESKINTWWAKTMPIFINGQLFHDRIFALIAEYFDPNKATPIKLMKQFAPQPKQLEELNKKIDDKISELRAFLMQQIQSKLNSK